MRAPLAHVADQVFLELAREIEAQGVRRQVVADMFGLALRSYQTAMCAWLTPGCGGRAKGSRAGPYAGRDQNVPP